MIKYLFRKVNLCESAANGGQNPAPPATKNCLRSPALTSALRVHGTSPTCNKMKPNGNNKTAPQSKSNMNTPTIVICEKTCNPNTHSHPRCANVTSNRKLRDQRRTPRMRNRTLQSESAMETHKQCAENKNPGTRTCAACHAIACYINPRASLLSFMLPI